MRAILARMRLLARFHDQEEFARVRALLREKGVPTWANTIESRRLGWQAVLHVCVDAQLDDALRLLRDPAHVPADVAADVPTDDLDRALEAAESAGFARLRELEQQAHVESVRQLERERTKLSGYFDYRDQAARDRLVVAAPTPPGPTAAVYGAGVLTGVVLTVLAVVALAFGGRK